MASALPFYVRDDDPAAKRAILRAAMKLFSERGLAATSIRDIAAKSGYTNPALYKHFASKEELALHLFETCHRRVWSTCSAALRASEGFDAQLEAYIGTWLELADKHPEVLAFLSDSERVLWPKSSITIRRKTMVGLARSVMSQAARSERRGSDISSDVAAASLQGTLVELARAVQAGLLQGPVSRWKPELVALFRQLVA
jgi:AcrR family transcriptional regulator